MREITILGDKVSPQDVDNAIKEVTYQRMGKKLLVCHILLVNGHEVLGYSGVVNPENYDENIGKPIAFNNAKNEVWKHLGSILQNRMAADCYVKSRTPDLVIQCRAMRNDSRDRETYAMFRQTGFQVGDIIVDVAAGTEVKLLVKVPEGEDKVFKVRGHVQPDAYYKLIYREE